MRLRTVACTLASLLSTGAGFVHAAAMPTREQIQAAVDAGVAKTASSMPMAVKVTSLLGCQDAQEAQGEVVCLVGMRAGMRDGFTVLPLRKENGGAWVGVERKHATFAGPSIGEAQALMRAWVGEEIARNPDAANDVQMQEAQTTMQVKALDACEVKRSTGYLVCDAVLSVPNRTDIRTAFTFMLESTGWRYVPR